MRTVAGFPVIPCKPAYATAFLCLRVRGTPARRDYQYTTPPGGESKENNDNNEVFFLLIREKNFLESRGTRVVKVSVLAPVIRLDAANAVNRWIANN
jgi:hypothetical protein